MYQFKQISVRCSKCGMMFHNLTLNYFMYHLFFFRYCVLLITGEDEAFLPGNKAFVDFATVNKKDVLRFAYVYQRQQQPLCQALLPNQAAAFPQVSSPTKSANIKKKINLFFFPSLTSPFDGTQSVVISDLLLQITDTRCATCCDASV